MTQSSTLPEYSVFAPRSCQFSLSDLRFRPQRRLGMLAYTLRLASSSAASSAPVSHPVGSAVSSRTQPPHLQPAFQQPPFLAGIRVIGIGIGSRVLGWFTEAELGCGAHRPPRRRHQKAQVKREACCRRHRWCSENSGGGYNRQPSTSTVGVQSLIRATRSDARTWLDEPAGFSLAQRSHPHTCRQGEAPSLAVLSIGQRTVPIPYQ